MTRAAPGIVLAALVIVLASACSAGGGGEVAPGEGAPLLELDVDEALAYVDDHAGAPVLINLWASWCPPCRDEAPALAAAAEAYEPQGVTFIGIDLEDRPDEARRFTSRFGITFPSIADPTGDISRAFGLRGIPVTVLLDARGEEVFRRIGSVSEAELVAALSSVLVG